MTVEQLQKLVVGALSLAEARVADNDKAGVASADFSEAAEAAAGRVIRGAQATSQLPSGGRRVLWVDDRPANNRRERNALESFGVEFTLAESTDEALQILERRRFAAIISDMGRREGNREGYLLLEAVRARDIPTPFLIYAGSATPEQRRVAAATGAQGATNVATELVDMVLAVLEGG